MGFLVRAVVRALRSRLFLGFILLGFSAPISGWSQESVVFGYLTRSLSGVDKQDGKIAVKMLMDKIAQKAMEKVDYRYQMETVVYDDLESILRAFRSQNIQILNLSSIEYLMAREQIALEPAYIISPESSPMIHYVFLTRVEDRITNLDQLRGKRLIVLNSVEGTLGLAWLHTVLASERLLDGEPLLSSIKKVDKVSQAVLPVFFHQSDACIVSRFAYETMCELNPQLKKNLSIVMESSGYVKDIVCFQTSMNEELKAFVRSAIQDVFSDEEGRQMLLFFRAEKAFRFDPKYLLNVESLYQDVCKIPNGKTLIFDELVRQN